MRILAALLVLAPTLTLAEVSVPAALATPKRSGEAGSAFVAEHQRAGQVAWLSWGDAAFTRAREQNKPLYVHIGALTSELSRDMARQSFANADTARYLNENFVCVLIDRDEHPDVAAVYRAWLQQAKQLNGWPLNLWLTPDLKPIEGATYLPPSEEWGKPGLLNVAKQVAGAWQADAAAQRSRADEAIAMLTSSAGAEVKPLSAAAFKSVLSDNAAAWEARFDPEHGGFNEPPKRLEPELLRYLLRHEATRAHAVATLVALARGAIRDPLDGGFFRQASDAAFRQPYLQKYAADQARIALAYLDALALPNLEAANSKPDTRNPKLELQLAGRGALRYLTTHLHDPKLGFLAAEDASGEGGAAYYLWTLADVQAALGGDAAATASALGITAEGNLPADAYAVPGVTTPNLPYLAAEDPGAFTEAARQKLLAARGKRPAPRRDTTTPAATHGLILFALSRAAAELNDPELRAAAQRQAAFIREQLRQPDGSLRHLAHRGTESAGYPEKGGPGTPFAGSSALAEDYVYVAKGLRAYAAATKDAAAEKLAADFSSRAAAFLDAKAGRFVVTKTGPIAALGAVHVPAPAPGELPSAESAFLGYLLRAEPQSPSIPALTAALSREAQDSPEAARGDLLLALGMTVDRGQ